MFLAWSVMGQQRILFVQNHHLFKESVAKPRTPIGTVHIPRDTQNRDIMGSDPGSTMLLFIHREIKEPVLTTCPTTLLPKRTRIIDRFTSLMDSWKREGTLSRCISSNEQHLSSALTLATMSQSNAPYVCHCVVLFSDHAWTANSYLPYISIVR